MPSLLINGLGGEIPKMDSRLLPKEMAQSAVNTDLTSGAPIGVPSPRLILDFTATPGPVERVYRLPGPNEGDGDAFLPLPSAFSSVVRSPLANDTLHRVYWTNPDDGAYWNTWSRIFAGNTGANAPYNLGFTNPNPITALTVIVTGGTTDGTIPLVSRAYVLTFVDEYGQESSPSEPSNVATGPPDGDWKVDGWLTAPPTTVGKNYPHITKFRLYRTVTGQNTGAQFYFVVEFPYTPTPPGFYIDHTLDKEIVLNNALVSTDFAPPPDKLDGMTALPGGMLCGFTRNTVHFCEPNYPHAWPAGYDQSVHYDVVALAVWQQSLVILTDGFPSTGSGNTPANFVINQVQVPEPCIARGSVVTDLLGVYYASQNGLMMLTYYGITNQTEKLIDKNVWITRYNAREIIGCRHRSQYLAINGTGVGFLIDYADPRLGVNDLNTFADATCIWNDVYTGSAFICADKKLYTWDDPNDPPLTYRWRSKEFYLPQPANYGAVQISADPSIVDVIPPLTPPLETSDPLLTLPVGVNAIFRCYVHGRLSHTENLLEPRSIFRMPSGFKAFAWSFEVVSRVKIFSIEVAPTMQELSSV